MHQPPPVRARVKPLDLVKDSLPPERALGIYWHVEDDAFGFDVDVSRLSAMPHTRRGILSVIASIYDPLGVISPFIMMTKIVLQELSRMQIKWDEKIPHMLQKTWNKWLQYLPLLSTFKIRRCLKSPSLGRVAHVELHHFADASERGYGTASYIRIIDVSGRIECSLLGSKSRLAPIRSISIPRLELSAAVLAVRVNHSMIRALCASIDRVFFWTDSTAVLRYIRNTTSRFHVFVANRLAVIHDGSDPEQWHHVRSEDNPADYVSRGQVGPNFVNNSQWKDGPRFLWLTKNIKTTYTDDLALLEDDSEVKRTSRAVCSLQVVSDELHPIRRLINYYSSCGRLTRAIAWLLRLKVYLRGKSDTQHHDMRIGSLHNLTEAEHIVLKHEQECVFGQDRLEVLVGHLRKGSGVIRLDPEIRDELLCIGGRLRNSDLDISMKHPILLPAKGKVTELLIQAVHEKVGHGGRQHVLSELRKQFWVIKGNSAVRRVLARCFRCRRICRQPEKQKMANLPHDRVSAFDPPFTNTGTDLFGPFFVSRGRSQVKKYGVIFSCLSTRAVHIEVACSLSTDSFICAFRRFLARRGSVKIIRSDQGTNLVGAKRELDRELRHLADHSAEVTTEMQRKKVQWILNPPQASNFGGAWERMIRSVRKILDFLIYLQKLTDETLQTFLCEVEYILNSRPLMPVSADPRDLNPLTPNDILLPRAVTMPAGLFREKDLHSKKLWRQAQYLADQFWVQWRTEYAPLLQERTRQRPRPNISVGDVVVLLIILCQGRGQWPFALVKSLRVSSDGLVRSANVERNGKSTRRPVNKMVLVVSHDHQI